VDTPVLSKMFVRWWLTVTVSRLTDSRCAMRLLVSPSMASARISCSRRVNPKPPARSRAATHSHGRQRPHDFAHRVAPDPGFVDAHVANALEQDVGGGRSRHVATHTESQHVDEHRHWQVQHQQECPHLDLCLPERAQHLETGQLGDRHIEQQDVGPQLERPPDRLDASVHLGDDCEVGLRFRAARMRWR
jgi:hypothetical protein